MVFHNGLIVSISLTESLQSLALSPSKSTPGMDKIRFPSQDEGLSVQLKWPMLGKLKREQP